MRLSASLVAATLVAVACQGPTPLPHGQAPGRSPPSTSHAPSPTGLPTLVAADWAEAPLDQEWSRFRDPSPGTRLPWLHAGRWQVTDVRTPAYTGRAWQAQEIQPQPYLSFRVWDGPPLGDRYALQVTVQPLSSPHFKPPVGEIAVIPYYLDPTHYLEVVVAADHLGVWIADGGTPGTDKGWQAIDFMPVRTTVGQLRPLELTVDLHARTLVVRSGDQSRTIESDFLRPRPHAVALRTVGNRFNVTELRLSGE